jgi:hypothetical protein
MKMIFGLASVLVFLVSCSHTPVASTTPATTERTPAEAIPSDLTIWSLQELAQNKRFDVLNELFNNHGINLEKLPMGYAAGAGARVLDIDNSKTSELLDNLVGKSWRGKLFFFSDDPKKSMGLNRIKKTVLTKTSITPMASFVTQLLDKHSLVPEAKSNVVILNYAKPVTKKYWQELALTQIQVYDVMVAVPGKYGPVFIGKTWLGKYHKDRNFEANDKDKLMAWFFLDFSGKALEVQKAEHWEGGEKETVMRPLPHMKKSELPAMPE